MYRPFDLALMPDGALPLPVIKRYTTGMMQRSNNSASR
jgi:hypothetical protein